MRVVLPFTVVLVGCSAFVSLDGLRVMDPGLTMDATVMDVAMDAPNDGDAMTPVDAGPICPQNVEGPTLVPVLDAGYCIDSTEVTGDQYQKFLDAKVDPSKQISLCAWNADFSADTPNGALPIVGMDWCDAYAYCAWAGKRLCGATGGGSIAYADFANPTTGQWFRACTAQGAQPYPYGASYDPHACNGVDHEAGALLPVGSMPTCTGGYPGIFDIVGNAGEWIDSCEDGMGEGGPGEDRCHTNGGTYFWNDPGIDWTKCTLLLEEATSTTRGKTNTAIAGFVAVASDTLEACVPSQ